MIELDFNPDYFCKFRSFCLSLYFLPKRKNHLLKRDRHPKPCGFSQEIEYNTVVLCGGNHGNLRKSWK